MAKIAEKVRNRGFVDDLASFIDPTQMLLAYQQPRRNTRLFIYSDLISQACSECFRWCDGGIYVFDGRIWIPCAYEEFKYIVRDAIVQSAGAGGDVLKGDWVDKEKKIMEYALDGVKSAPLWRNPSIVGFTNGVWDFSDVGSPVRHKFSERLPITGILPYAYDPESGCPVWTSFLKAMLPARDIRVLQKFFALSFVSREEHSVESSLWLIGSGANGKSTIERVIPLVFGQDSVSHARLDSLMDRNIDARMRAMGRINGCKFNICEEISDTDIEKGSDIFKSLVSGQTQQARGIGKDIYDARDIPFFVFTMNTLPSNKRMDEAFRRRMVKIYFRSSVKREDMDTALVSKLAMELSGILNWVLDGYSQLVRDNFSVQTAGETLSDEDVDMMTGNGQTADVWLAHCAIWPSRHVGHESDEVALIVPMPRLYAEYESFCRNYLNTEPGTVQQLGRDLRRLNFEWKRRSGGSNYVVYCDKRNKLNTNNHV